MTFSSGNLANPLKNLMISISPLGKSYINGDAPHCIFPVCSIFVLFFRRRFCVEMMSCGIFVVKKIFVVEKYHPKSLHSSAVSLFREKV